jgi:hypothetical protein
MAEAVPREKGGVHDARGSKERGRAVALARCVEGAGFQTVGMTWARRRRWPVGRTWEVEGGTSVVGWVWGDHYRPAALGSTQ